MRQAWPAKAAVRPGPARIAAVVTLQPRVNLPASEVLSVANAKRSLVVALLCLPLAVPVLAKTSDPEDGHWCGTTKFGVGIEMGVHFNHQSELDRARATEKSARASAPNAYKVGDIAVIEDDGSIVIQPNPVDVADFGIQYVPQKKGGYVVSPSSDPILEDVGNEVTLDDDDHVDVPLPKGFKFKFFNKAYTKLYVQSDGNITFGAADDESSERDLSRLAGGPARIAPFFADLNPSVGGNVFVKTDKAKVVVTWRDVPEFGAHNRNNFQVVMYATGRITFAFGHLDGRDALVGISPGSTTAVQIVDYKGELPAGPVNAVIAERFATTQALDNLAIAKAFFRNFADDYDHLVVFLDFDQSLGQAFAFEITIKNEIKGIGEDIFDFSKFAGSTKGRLRSFVQMGSLSHYPADPTTTFLGTNNSLDILGQETGHRWLVKFKFLDQNGDKNPNMLGRQDVHWNFCYNSFASDMEGNEIREDGSDRFTTVASTERYSRLDMYAMGLIGAEDVPDSFYVDPCINKAGAPQTGIGIIGQRMPVTMDSILAAEGPRVPNWTKAPHTFNEAFILVTPGGGPTDGALEKLDRLRAAWEPYFANAVEGRGSVSTAIKLK
jgi:hypothetical protein